MKDFVIITKQDCGRCDILKDWFLENGISYRETSVNSLEIPQELLNDKKFRDKFCTSHKCKFYVPLLHLTESGEYYYKYMFGIDGIRTKFLRDLLEVDGKSTEDGKTIREPKLCRNDLVESHLKKYILAIGICRSGGDLLYSIQLDKRLNLDLITQFISALSMFGEENLGKIERITIKGLEIEMSIVSKYDLIFLVLFKSDMVQDYLNEESEKGLDKFHQIFQTYISQNKTNKALYYSFDTEMCLLIQDYLVRIGVLECIDCSLEIPILRELSSTL
ncbi:hypothetical protein DSAG12_01044 [Promethearchaeum syntrophicum]|uniref:Glutaredoxin domain-containing protein n=1 Tax=Promethearchaeum syntrophicum TaxID=2594042 RepID=A0A5B9D8Z9_9ARCH|nr:hypothetical protein [Candidatus Prometheoarchaeum syntrophicum]QEE15220.1 hypothetical protein DSAG12_01044 [Candidatus Prometheoarchaeum syntrophicum]